MMRHLRWYVALYFCGAALLAGCGGAVDTTPIASSQFAVSTTVPVSSSGALTASLAAPGYFAELTLTGITSPGASGSTLQVTMQDTPLTGFPMFPSTLQATARVAQATRVVAATKPLDASFPIGTVVWISMNAARGIDWSSGTLFLTFPPSLVVPGDAYYMAIDPDPEMAWQLDWAGPATYNAAASALQFTLPPSAGTCSVCAFVVYGVSSSVLPAPSPSPASGTTVITVPTPAPVVCSPPADVVGVNQTNIIDCTEQGYAGPFTVTVADPTIASVQQSNSLTFTFFNVTGLKAGTTTVTLQSQPGATASVAITVDP